MHPEVRRPRPRKLPERRRRGPDLDVPDPAAHDRFVDVDEHVTHENQPIGVGEAPPQPRLH